jgi:4-aminobutyrate aminotransferase / (S)-3-amino-2-methylpropionate transaminase / 5-aminovalerate transaminase
MDAFGTQLPQLRFAPPGAASQAWVEQLAAAECPALTARRARREERAGAPQDPIVWAEARGANVRDVDGNVYVDLSAGFGAASVGHAHPQVVQAITTQSQRLLHALGDLQPSDVKIALLLRLAALLPGNENRVMLGLSGSDAVEAALKTALLFTQRPGVVAFEGGYHGLSHGPLAACGYSAAFREPFRAQLNPHVQFAPYPHNAHALSGALAAVSGMLAAGNTGAVLVEPMLGRGGVVVPPASFLPELSALCRRHGALLIVDEIMTGFARTGRMFGFEHSGVVPDLVCLGKALGGGMPVSACVGSVEIMAAWGSSTGEALHTGTFFGHPLASAAALATLDVLASEQLTKRAGELGSWLLEQLQALQQRAPIAAVRGMGLLIGIELESGEHGLRCIRALLERGYIAVPAAADARVVSLTPPLNITQAQLAGFTRALADSLV